MHKLITIFLLFAFLLYTFRQAATIVNYYTNIDAYAKQCINKKKAAMKCHGRCQMQKHLKSQEENADSKLSLKQTSAEPFTAIYCNEAPDALSTELLIHHDKTKEGDVVQLASATFRPPLVA